MSNLVTGRGRRGRWVALPIQDITRIFADYAGLVGFPHDAKPVKWQLNAPLRKIRLVVEAESLSGHQPTEEIKFQLKQIYKVS